MSTTFETTGHKEVFKAIHRSQHCQRNFDLTKEIPQADLELLKVAATQCPSKQNQAHYRVHFITNRDVIEKIYAQTDGFTVSRNPDGTLIANVHGKETIPNTQVLANLLVVLEDYEKRPMFANFNAQDVTKHKKAEAVKMFDRNVAVGIAAGYLNLTASMLGYGTGCCSCMNHAAIKEILGFTGEPLLLMGIGYKDPSRNRRESQVDETFMFPTKKKQDIEVKIWN